MDFVISLVISLIITAFAYLLVPIIVCIIGRRSLRLFSKKTIRKIVIINGVCVWLIFQIIRLIQGDTGISTAVFLWSAVAYWIMNKSLVIQTAEVAAPIQADTEASNPVNPIQYIYKKEKYYKIAIGVMAILFALSLGLNLYQGGLIAEAENNAKQLENEPSHSQSDSNLNAEKLEFYDENIVFVEDDNTNLYHKYECDRFKGNYFWAYNVELAIYMEYQPCPICCKE